MLLPILMSSIGAFYIHQAQEARIKENMKEIQASAIDTTLIRDNLEQAQAFVKGAAIHRPTKGEQYAVIRVKRIEFEKDLYMGDDSAQLDAGIGQYIYSGLPGEGKPLLLAGHNGTQFYKLHEVEKGDLVEITTEYGTYTYRVTHMEIQNADDFDTNKLNEEKEYLIMYTCYPFHIINTPQRYFVYAEFVSGPKIVGNIS